MREPPLSDSTDGIPRGGSSDQPTPPPAGVLYSVTDHELLVVDSRSGEVRWDPPMLPSDSGIPDTLERVLLGPRHEGVFLNDADIEWPVHVYVTTAPPVLDGASEIPPDALKIRIWGLLVGGI